MPFVSAGSYMCISLLFSRYSFLRFTNAISAVFKYNLLKKSPPHPSLSSRVSCCGFTQINTAPWQPSCRCQMLFLPFLLQSFPCRGMDKERVSEGRKVGCASREPGLEVAQQSSQGGFQPKGCPRCAPRVGEQHQLMHTGADSAWTLLFACCLQKKASPSPRRPEFSLPLSGENTCCG